MHHAAGSPSLGNLPIDAPHNGEDCLTLQNVAKASYKLMSSECPSSLYENRHALVTTLYVAKASYKVMITVANAPPGSHIRRRRV